VSAAEACQCAAAGACPLFARMMCQRDFEICRGEALLADGTPMPAEYRAAYRFQWGLRAGFVLPPPPPPSGPGVELAKLIAMLGAKPRAHCHCDEMIGRMNAWGVAGCRAHRAEIVAHLAGAYAGLTWEQVAVAVGQAVTSGLARRLNPLDVCGSLVDLAIERAGDRWTG
jgi:hypothetical protein